MLAPDGKQFTQREAERLAQYERIVLLCGRYEGFDARVEKLVDEKISIGPYVLAGGDIEMNASISGRRINSCMPIQAPKEYPATQQDAAFGL